MAVVVCLQESLRPLDTLSSPCDEFAVFWRRIRRLRVSREPTCSLRVRTSVRYLSVLPTIARLPFFSATALTAALIGGRRSAGAVSRSFFVLCAAIPFPPPPPPDTLSLAAAAGRRYAVARGVCHSPPAMSSVAVTIFPAAARRLLRKDSL